jgi:hypothetical protein
MFETGNFSDFQISVNHGTEKTIFFVHKCILAPWDFFRNILAKHGPNVIHDTEMPISAFRKILEYFYLGTPESLDFSEAGWILSLSGYYALEDQSDLAFACRKKINSELNSENWQQALQAGMEIGIPELRDRAMEAIPKAEFGNLLWELRAKNSELEKRVDEINSSSEQKISELSSQVKSLEVEMESKLELMRKQFEEWRQEGRGRKREHEEGEDRGNPDREGPPKKRTRRQDDENGFEG